MEELNTLKQTLTETITNKDKAADTFGAPVLSASTGAQAVIEDPDWTPPESKLKRRTEKPKPAVAVTVPTKEKKTHPSVIAGMIVGAFLVVVVIITLIIVALFYAKKYHNSRKQREYRSDPKFVSPNQKNDGIEQVASARPISENDRQEHPVFGSDVKASTDRKLVD